MDIFMESDRYSALNDGNWPILTYIKSILLQRNKSDFSYWTTKLIDYSIFDTKFSILIDGFFSLKLSQFSGV